jgi:FO synthase
MDDDASSGTAGLGVEGRLPVGSPWQEPDADWGSSGRVDLHVEVDTVGRAADRRSDFSDVYGDWESLREKADGAAERRAGAPERLDRDVAAALAAVERAAACGRVDLGEEHALALAHADGPDLRALCALADDLRREATGDLVTYVVTRNVNFTNVCYTGCRFCAFAQRKTDADAYTLSLDEVGRRAEEAWAAGATEICMQGGIHPDLPGSAYVELAREIKRRVPGIHVHAFSPMEVVNGASRMDLSIRDFLLAVKEAGVSSIPGTAAEILDDDVRWLLTKGKLPAAQWVEVISTAHEVGLPSSSTMMYGHVDTPAHWVGHLRTLAAVQDRSLDRKQSAGGAAFTEFVLLPFVHQNSPIYLAGVARPGPTPRDNLAAHALARVMLHGRIKNIQTSWVKLGAAGAQAMLRAGANDLGGTLMEETISRMAGSAHGSAMTPSQLEAVAAGIGRPVRQRTTLYGEVPAERVEASRRVTTYLPMLTHAATTAAPTPSR